MIFPWIVAASLAIVFAVREALQARAYLICCEKSDQLFEKLQSKFDVGPGACAIPAGSHPNEINHLD